MRNGMTLFEVTVSLGLVVFASVTVLAVLPQAVRTQERIKAGTLAASRVLEMAHTFNNTPFTNYGVDDSIPLRHATQIKQPWDSAAWRLAQTPDAEHKLGSMTGGLCPLPTTIARRLDSDGDEIQRLLDEGGYVYYTNPISPAQIPLIRRDIDSYTSTVEVPSESRRLVFGIVGHAQQNSIPRFPWRPSLIHFPYPSPPHAPGDCASTAGMSDASRVILSTLSDGNPAGFAATFYGAHTDETQGERYPGKALPARGTPRTAQVPADVLRYYLVARWYARKQLHPLIATHPSLYAKLLRGDVVDRQECATVLAAGRPSGPVNAMRYLAHAAMALTRVYTKAELDVGVATAVALDFQPAIGIPYEDASLSGVDDVGSGKDLPVTRITLPMIIEMHQSCMRLAMLYAASYPNDWVAPRPLNRAIMTDVPLLQWDVRSTPLSGRMFPSADPATATTQRQWLAVGSSDLSAGDLGFGGQGLWFANQDTGWSRSNANGNLGFYIGQDFRTLTANAGIWSGQPANFNLAAPFEPRERCRQIVVWAVDWQAYEDFETAPSAPMDSSRIPLDIPNRRQADMYDSGVTTLVKRLTAVAWKDWEHPSYRNPEKMIQFVDDVSAAPSAQPVRVYGSTKRWRSAGSPLVESPDQPIGAWTSTMIEAGRILTGAYGADRNGNRLLDRGPVPTTQRMRATQVARFNFYDPRVPLCFK